MNLLELQQKIDEADFAYYTTGKAILDDAQYDSLRNELKSLNPTDIRLTRVGAAVRETIYQKRTHSIIMSSLNKASTEKEYTDWLNNNDLLHCTFHASLKADGGSYSFEYQQGRLAYAVSRGDGEAGEDITANALKFRNLPKFVKYNDKPFSGFVRGEVILDNESWEIADPELSSNPRNLAVGIAGRKDGFQSELLRVLAFRIYDENRNLLGDSETDQSNILKFLGFETITFIEGNAEQVWNWYLKIQKERPSLDFWIDGIVLKVWSLFKQLDMGETEHHPKGQIALKFEAEKATTILRGYHLQVGHTGAITPIAEIDPVRLGGATVTEPTLHNWNIIRELDIAIGDTVEVIKAGDIIPKIINVTNRPKDRQPIPEPDKCPCCGEKTGVKTNVSGEVSTIIYCFNPNCSAKILGKINRFVKSLKILEIGDAVVETLVKEGFLKDPADLYTLMLYKDTLKDLMFNGRVTIGEKRITNLLTEIELKRTLTLSEFLGSLGIAGLGKRRVELVQEAMPGEFDLLTDWTENLKLVKYSDKIGLPNIAQNLYAEINKLKILIDKFLKNGLVIKKKEVKIGKQINETICITGALSRSRNEYKKLIEESGRTFVNTFTKKISYLVTNDTEETTKLRKARENRIKIISEEELIELLRL